MIKKQKPYPPIRHSWHNTLHSIDEGTFKLTDLIKATNATVEELYIEYVQGDGDYSYGTLNLQILEQESDDSFEKRKDTYEFKLAQYNKWFAKNEKAIEAQEQAKKVKAAERKKQEAVRYKSELVKQALAIQKKLKELE